MVRIQPEDTRTALLEIQGAPRGFGLHARSSDECTLGFDDAPLYRIERSYPEERLFVETIPGGIGIRRERVAFENGADDWLRDSSCTDCSLFARLPDGRYRIVKTQRNAVRSDSVLMGNEWTDAGTDTCCFDGCDRNEVHPRGRIDGPPVKEMFFSTIHLCGGTPSSVRAQPLLAVIVPDYGMVWSGATGVLFFSFSRCDDVDDTGGAGILAIPYAHDFIMHVNDRDDTDMKALRRIIDDFIRIIWSQYADRMMRIACDKGFYAMYLRAGIRHSRHKISLHFLEQRHCPTPGLTGFP